MGSDGARALSARSQLRTWTRFLYNSATIRIHLEVTTRERLRDLRREILPFRVRDRIELRTLVAVGGSAPWIASRLGTCDQPVRDTLKGFRARGIDALNPRRTNPAPDAGGEKVWSRRRAAGSTWSVVSVPPQKASHAQEWQRQEHRAAMGDPGPSVSQVTVPESRRHSWSNCLVGKFNNSGRPTPDHGAIDDSQRIPDPVSAVDPASRGGGEAGNWSSGPASTTRWPRRQGLRPRVGGRHQRAVTLMVITPHQQPRPRT